MFKSMVFWERNNLEISVFESRVVRLRTGKTALNTFKNIHLQSNVFESSKEGPGWWRVPATSSGVAGGLGTLCGLRPRQASGRRLPSWPQCLWPPCNKGKGRLVLPSVKSSLGQVHLEAGPAGGQAPRRGCRRTKHTRLWKGLLCGPPRESPSPSSFSVFGFLQEKILAPSLTKIPYFILQKDTRRQCREEKKSFPHSPALCFFPQVGEEHSGVSQRWCCCRQHRATRLCFQEAMSYTSLSRFKSCQTLLHQRQGWGRQGGAPCPVPAKGSPELCWASTTSSHVSRGCFKHLCDSVPSLSFPLSVWPGSLRAYWIRLILTAVRC